MATTFLGVNKGILIQNDTDRSKQVSLEADAAATTDTKTSIIASQTADRIITVPDATDTLMGKATTDVMTNKSYDADGTGNVLTNIENENIKASAAIDATKLADGSVSNTEYQYLSGVTSSIQDQISSNSDGLSDHISDATDAHAASAISNVPSGNLTATDVQNALNELQTDIDNSLVGAGSSTDDALVRFDGTSGSLIQNSLGILNDAGALSGLTQLNVDNLQLNGNTVSATTGDLILDGADIDANSNKIKNLTDPTLAQDAATKAYADLSIPKSIVDAKGDLISATADNTPARLAVGLNGQILTADSVQSTGLKWAEAPVGIKNILSQVDSNFERGVADWITYDDGASSQPVDGTGGSPTVITISATTTAGEVLQGLSSLKIAKSAADGQGEGTSVLSQTVDRADQGKPFFVYFSYDASHANFVTGDLKVFAYDVTNSQLLTVNGDSNNGQLLQQKGQMSGVIFPQDTCTSIRLIVHCTSVNALAYNVFIDEVVITPQATITGPVMTDWQNYTPTFTGFGTVSTSAFQWKREGSDMLVRGRFIAGTTTAVEAQVTLPTGYTSNSTIGTLEVAGVYGQSANGTISQYTAIEASKTYFVFTRQFTSENSNTKANGNAVAATGGTISLNVRIPILDWTAGASLTANDAGLQTARFFGTQSSQAVTANVTNVTFTAVKDNYNSWSTNQFTVPKSGDYVVSGGANVSGGGTLRVYKNGTSVGTFATASLAADGTGGSVTVPNCIVGDILSIRCTTSITLTNGTLSISRIPDFNVFGVQGPIVVAASTDWIDAGAMIISATTTAPTKGTATIQTDKVRYRRVGDSAEVTIDYRQTAAGTATAGTGDYLFGMPAGLQIDTTKCTAYSTVEGWSSAAQNLFVKGIGTASDGTNSLTASIVPYDSNYVRVFGHLWGATGTGGALGTSGFPLTAANAQYSLTFTVPIVGWSSETRLYPSQRVIGTTYLTDEKANTTNGGTATSGSYQTRTLNTQRGDTGFCSLSSNQFTLNPGVYEISGLASFGFSTGLARIKIRNTSDSTDAVVGINMGNNSSAAYAAPHAALFGRIDITSTKTFELQSRVSTTQATTGFGSANSFGDTEIFAQVKIEKIY